MKHNCVSTDSPSRSGFLCFSQHEPSPTWYILHCLHAGHIKQYVLVEMSAI